MKLIAGLGNPGKEYEKTRHNSGFMAMDKLANKLSNVTYSEKWNALCAKVNINGENVLSTTNFKLCFFAIFASDTISATSNNGLLTVSQYKTLVLSLIAASTTSNFVMSTNDVLMPNFGVKFFKNAYVPP